MSFNVVKELALTKQYAEIGVTGDTETVTTTLTYAVDKVTIRADGSADFEYTISVPGAKEPGRDIASFAYDGVGNPLLQAEDVLKGIVS